MLVTLALVGAGAFFYVEADDAARNGETGQQEVRLPAPAAPPAPPPLLQAGGATGSALTAGQSAVAPVATPGLPVDAATTASPHLVGAGLPSPREQRAAEKILVEGHWHGMELIELNAALARQNGIAPGQKGVLVDEVSLTAAESGVFAGDVLRSVGGMRIASLQDLGDATYVVRDQHQVELGVVRGGRSIAVVMQTAWALGFAMFEAASPIPPGAVSPHADRGRPCTDCHVIMAWGGQLAKDAGDLTPIPPPITAGAVAPHGDRGPCNACHVVAATAALPR